jgi:hypothetical protein
MNLFILNAGKERPIELYMLWKIQLLDKTYETQCGAIGNILGGTCHGNLGNMRWTSHMINKDSAQWGTHMVRVISYN